MNAAAHKTTVVDIERAARKVLRDPHGLSGVAATDLIGLAQYALQADEAPRLTPELAAAIAGVIKNHEKLDLAYRVFRQSADRTRASFELATAVEEYAEHLHGLQTLFETEFPR